jgi:hypothetical protein
MCALRASAKRTGLHAIVSIVSQHVPISQHANLGFCCCTGHTSTADNGLNAPQSWQHVLTSAINLATTAHLQKPGMQECMRASAERTGLHAMVSMSHGVASPAAPPTYCTYRYASYTCTHSTT